MQSKEDIDYNEKQEIINELIAGIKVKKEYDEIVNEIQLNRHMSTLKDDIIKRIPDNVDEVLEEEGTVDKWDPLIAKRLLLIIANEIMIALIKKNNKRHTLSKNHKQITVDTKQEYIVELMDALAEYHEKVGLDYYDDGNDDESILLFLKEYDGVILHSKTMDSFIEMCILMNQHFKLLSRLFNKSTELLVNIKDEAVKNGMTEASDAQEKTTEFAKALLSADSAEKDIEVHIRDEGLLIGSLIERHHYIYKKHFSPYMQHNESQRTSFENHPFLVGSDDKDADPETTRLKTLFTMYVSLADISENNAIIEEMEATNTTVSDERKDEIKKSSDVVDQGLKVYSGEAAMLRGTTKTSSTYQSAGPQFAGRSPLPDNRKFVSKEEKDAYLSAFAGTPMANVIKDIPIQVDTTPFDNHARAVLTSHSVDEKTADKIIELEKKREDLVTIGNLVLGLTGSANPIDMILKTQRFLGVSGIESAKKFQAHITRLENSPPFVVADDVINAFQTKSRAAGDTWELMLDFMSFITDEKNGGIRQFYAGTYLMINNQDLQAPLIMPKFFDAGSDYYIKEGFFSDMFNPSIDANDVFYKRILKGLTIMIDVLNEIYDKLSFYNTRGIEIAKKTLVDVGGMFLLNIVPACCVLLVQTKLDFHYAKPSRNKDSDFFSPLMLFDILKFSTVTILLYYSHSVFNRLCRTGDVLKGVAESAVSMVKKDSMLVGFLVDKKVTNRLLSIAIQIFLSLIYVSFTSEHVTSATFINMFVGFFVDLTVSWVLDFVGRCMTGFYNMLVNSFGFFQSINSTLRTIYVHLRSYRISRFIMDSLSFVFKSLLPFMIGKVFTTCTILLVYKGMNKIMSLSTLAETAVPMFAEGMGESVNTPAELSVFFDNVGKRSNEVYRGSYPSKLLFNTLQTAVLSVANAKIPYLESSIADMFGIGYEVTNILKAVGQKTLSVMVSSTVAWTDVKEIKPIVEFVGAWILMFKKWDFYAGLFLSAGEFMFEFGFGSTVNLNVNLESKITNHCTFLMANTTNPSEIAEVENAAKLLENVVNYQQVPEETESIKLFFPDGTEKVFESKSYTPLDNTDVLNMMKKIFNIFKKSIDKNTGFEFTEANACNVFVNTIIKGSATEMALLQQVLSNANKNELLSVDVINEFKIATEGYLKSELPISIIEFIQKFGEKIALYGSNFNIPQANEMVYASFSKKISNSGYFKDIIKPPTAPKRDKSTKILEDSFTKVDDILSNFLGVHKDARGIMYGLVSLYGTFKLLKNVIRLHKEIKYVSKEIIGNEDKDKETSRKLFSGGSKALKETVYNDVEYTNTNENDLELLMSKIPFIRTDEYKEKHMQSNI